MGTFFHPITIVGPNGEETVEALVDTGILFAQIPEDVLARLGILPEERKYRGRGVTQARGRLAGRDGWPMVVFVPAGDQAKIGSHTLEGFLLDIDEDGNLVEKIFHEVRHF